MTVWLWMITIFFFVSLAILFAMTFSANSRNASVNRLARSVGLAVPVGQETALAARAARRTRASAIGAMAGTVIVVAGFLSGIIPGGDEIGNSSNVWLLLGGYFIGLAVGAMINALTYRSTLPEGARFARSGAVGLKDYLAPIDRIGMRASVAVGVLTLVAATLLFIAGYVPLNPLVSVSAVVIGLSVASLVVFEVVSRRIIDRAQPVGSPAELAWDDAMRAQNVREIATAPLSLGLWGAFAVLMALINQPIAFTVNGDVLFAILLAATIGLVNVAIAAAIFSLATKPQQHYRRRLWPDITVAPAAAPQQPAAAR